MVVCPELDGDSRFVQFVNSHPERFRLVWPTMRLTTARHRRGGMKRDVRRGTIVKECRVSLIRTRDAAVCTLTGRVRQWARFREGRATVAWPSSHI